MKTNYSPHTLNMAMELLDAAPRGVALCDEKGSLIHCNALFPTFSLPCTTELINQSIGLGIESFDHKVNNKSIRIQIRKLVDGYGILAEDIEGRFCAREETIANLVATEASSLFDEVVKNISEVSGWRWVAISRFKDDHTVEILSMLDKKQKVDNYLYDLMGTPCEVVARTKQFAFFPKLNDRFPYYRALHEMGAKVYAGMVYHLNQVPIGHIFAMHDTPEVDEPLIEDVIRLSTSIVGYKLEVGHAQDAARSAVVEASIDALTQVLNRRAFDQDIATCIDYVKQNKFSDTLLGIIDLDGMKQINDTQGHDAGDTLLKVFSESLTACSRPEDKIYRLGGDEFAVILNGAGFAQINAIHKRVENAVNKTRQANFPNIDASIGFASLSEIKADAGAWFQLADERMYKHKKSKT